MKYLNYKRLPSATKRSAILGLGPIAPLVAGFVLSLTIGASSAVLQTTAPAPTVQAITPNTGSTLGGTSVTVNGSNFVDGATLSIGGNPATNVTVVDANTITATTPAIATAGPASVVVTNPDNQTATLPASRLTNAGFESGSINWKFTGTGSATVVSNSANAHSGSSYAELSVSAGQKANFVAADSAGNPVFLPVNPGDVLDFGGWANRIAGDGMANFTLVVFDSNKANPIYLSPIPNDAGSGGWALLTRRYTIPATGAFVRIYAQVFNTTVPGTVRFDDAVLTGGFLVTTATTAAPDVTSVTPTTVGTGGGDTVTVNGANFVSGAHVSFGGALAASVTVNNANTITAITPAHAAGTVNVSVTNTDGQSATLTSAITYSTSTNPAPSITDISPNNGAATGGTTTTITGANFAPGATVTFGGVTASATVTNSTTIVATTPAHSAGNVDVVVKNPDNQVATLSANRLSNPGYESGAAGWVKTGTGGTATAVNNSANAHSGAEYLEMTASSGQHPTFFNADTSNRVMDFPVSPSDIVDFSGWAFRVAGDGIGKYTIAVLDGAKANASYISPSPSNVAGAAWTQESLRYTVPSGKAFIRFYSEILNPTANTTIRFDDAFLTGGFVYTGQNAAPNISSISPSSGPSTASTSVTITGTGFNAGATVTIGGSSCSGAAVSGSTTITCTAPPHTAGTFDVVVTNSDGQSDTLPSGFTYTGSTAPAISGVSPNAGSDSGGDTITIDGANFNTGAQVLFDTTAGSNAVVSDPNTISVTTPAHPAGTANVTVKNADGQSATATAAFSFVSSTTSSVSVASITPISGPTTGGTGVTIRGTGFTSGATVTIGGKAATGVTVVNSTTITATTASNSVGMAAVSVTSGGVNGTLPATLNPAVNPGFESGTTGWKFGGTGTATVKTSSTLAHSGTHYLELAANSGQHPQYFALGSTGSDYFPVKPGDAVIFGGWVKRISGTTGTAKFTLEVRDANKANPSYISTFPANVSATSWTKQQWTYFVPGGKAFVRIFAELNGVTSSTVVDYDDMILLTPSGYRYQYPTPAANSSLSSKIQHIVMFVQENRSLDTYFGTLGPYFLKRNPSTTATFDGLHPNTSTNTDPNITNLDRSNTPIHPFRVITACFDSLNPGWNESHRDVDGGKMDLFMKNSAYVTTNDPNGRRALAYTDETYLNYYYELAFQYGTSDRWFSSLLSGTFPNRMYLTGATSLGEWQNSPPVPAGGWLAETLYDRLDQKGISWKYYYQDPNTIEIKNWTTYTRDASKVVPLSQYYTDLTNGTLPQVVFIERGFDDEHPGKNFQPGQQLGKKIIDALMASSAWSSSIYIQTYDEGGGLYDHVPPATVVPPDNIAPKLSSTDFQAGFNQSGFRVPLLVVSPYAKKNFVSHKVRDFTAMLKLVETRFGLEPLTARDNAADNMVEFFDFVSTPRLTKPALPTPVTNILCDYSKGDGQ